MKKIKFAPNQIFMILKEWESGAAIEAVSRSHGVNTAILYSSRGKDGGLQLKKMKPLINTVFFFILISNIAVGQSRCDEMPNNAKIFAIVEEMPESNLSDVQIAKLLNDRIDLTKYSLTTTEAVYYGVTVNCRGEAFDYKIMRTIDADLDARILQVLKSNLTWSPGRSRGKPVDVRVTKPVYIVDDQFRILTDKQWKRLMKRKR